MIKGGYYIKAKRIQNSKIMHSSPAVRETWDWLLLNAAYEDNKQSGFVIKRGQLFCSIADIINGLHWFEGWKKCTYSSSQLKRAIGVLRGELMVTTTREPRGMLITICKYDYYQDINNFMRTDDRTNDRTDIRATGVPTGDLSIKEKKEIRKEKTINNNIKKSSFYSSAMNFYNDWFINRFNLKPQIDGIDGKGLKTIESFLKKNFPAADDNTILEAFKAVLNDWDNVDPFYQKQARLRQIASNMTNIIVSIKSKSNGTKEAYADRYADIERRKREANGN